jgi:peptide chain release factor 1
MAGDDSDPAMQELAVAERGELEERAGRLLEELKGELVTSDDRQVGSVILEIRAGVGGDEAALWAGDLLLMYERYAGRHGWKWEVMDAGGAEVGGVRQAVVNVRGDGVWLGMGYEGGTHCVKRVPATETQGRVHTSTATVAVLPEPKDVDVQINPEDVEVHITTAQGPGGQNVNKVATAVKMRHVPTGIEVRMQDTKSQHQNREKAWQLLRARLHEQQSAEAEAERAASRSKMIGGAGRAERIRTYRYKDNIAVDHRLSESYPLQAVLNGELDAMVDALIERDKAQRLAAL